VGPSQIVYVLTGNSIEAALRYVEGVRLSIASLRRFHREAIITCFCDSTLYHELEARSHPLRLAVDQLVECPDAAGGPVHRSRHIKTSLRRRLAGRFTYIDADTIVTAPLDDLVHCEAELGVTLDLYFPQAPGRFPRWLRAHYRRLGWEPVAVYYNGGIFCVADCERIHRLFDSWHENWRRTVKIGLIMDQPSMNRAIALLEPSIEVFPECYNLIVGRAERSIPPDVKVVSFLASRANLMMGRYSELVARAGAGATVDASEIASLTMADHRLPHARMSWHGELRRRLGEALAQAAARHGLRDASRE
jgi:hypothetical protein